MALVRTAGPASLRPRWHTLVLPQLLVVCLLCFGFHAWHGQERLHSLSLLAAPGTRARGLATAGAAAASGGMPTHTGLPARRLAATSTTASAQPDAGRRLQASGSAEAAASAQGERPGAGSGGAASEAAISISHIAIVGERHSGTNLLEQLLKRNLDSKHVEVKQGLTEHRQQPADSAKLPAAPRKTLVVVAVRNAYDWIVALNRNCYCCKPMEQFSLPKFVHAPYTQEGMRDGDSDVRCDSDVNIDANRAIHENVLKMRSAKLRNFLELNVRLGVFVEVARWEDMLEPTAKAAFVRRLVSKYNLRLASPEAGLEASEQPAGTAGGSRPQAAEPVRRPATPLPQGAEPAAAAAGPEEAFIETMVDEDARSFVSTPFSAALATTRSLYLNPEQLAMKWSRLAPAIQAITSGLDWDLEWRAGYHSLGATQRDQGLAIIQERREAMMRLEVAGSAAGAAAQA